MSFWGSCFLGSRCCWRGGIGGIRSEIFCHEWKRMDTNFKKTATAFRAAMATDTGRQRPINEDRVYVDEARGIFLVIDGVGGHVAGEKAAQIAVEIIPLQLESMTGSAESRV